MLSGIGAGAFFAAAGLAGSGRGGGMGGSGTSTVGGTSETLSSSPGVAVSAVSVAGSGSLMASLPPAIAAAS
jgi:hypothetical protein